MQGSEPVLKKKRNDFMKKLKICATVVSMILVFALLYGCGKQNKSENVEKEKNKVANTADFAENGDDRYAEGKSKLGFSNVSLEKAVAECLEKEATELTEDDILSVRYLAIGPEANGINTVYVGFKDYVDNALEKNADIENLKKYVKTAVIENTENLEEDLGKFKNIEMFEYYDFEIKDVSFLTNYSMLIFGYFKKNGIIDVSPLADYNPQTLVCLDFTGNDIDDWSYLYHMTEKIVVKYEVKMMTDSNGETVEVPLETWLDEFIGSEAENSDGEGTASLSDDLQDFGEID